MEVPFDVKSYRFIEYTHTSEGLETLKLKLRDQVHEILSLDKSETFSNPVTDGLSVENKQSLYPETWPGLIAFLARKFRPWQQFLIAILVLVIGGAGGIGIYSIYIKAKRHPRNASMIGEELAKVEENNKTLLSEDENLKARIKELGTPRNLDTSNEDEKPKEFIKVKDSNLNKFIEAKTQLELDYANIKNRSIKNKYK